MLNLNITDQQASFLKDGLVGVWYGSPLITRFLFEKMNGDRWTNPLSRLLIRASHSSPLSLDSLFYENPWVYAFFVN